MGKHNCLFHWEKTEVKETGKVGSMNRWQFETHSTGEKNRSLRLHLSYKLLTIMIGYPSKTLFHYGRQRHRLVQSGAWAVLQNLTKMCLTANVIVLLVSPLFPSSTLYLFWLFRLSCLQQGQPIFVCICSLQHRESPVLFGTAQALQRHK